MELLRVGCRNDDFSIIEISMIEIGVPGSARSWRDGLWNSVILMVIKIQLSSDHSRRISRLLSSVE